MIHSITFASLHKGPRFLVLGVVHGTEPCGAIATRRVIAEMESGALKLTCGQVTFVPVCNPRAYEKGVRSIDRNLNRYLRPMEKPDCYEAEIGNVLCPLLEKCDVLLDIHSYTAGGAPFVIAGLNDTKGQAFGRAMGDVAVITGWEESFAATGRQKEKTEDADESIGTCEYASRFGAMAMTLECGQNQDPRAPEIAYQGIHNALAYLGMIEKKNVAAAASARSMIRMTHVYYREDNGTLARAWKHLEPIAKGVLIATRESGEKILAPADGFIIMPNTPPPGWFYFGVESPSLV